jgi:hypothetical protein
MWHWAVRSALGLFALVDMGALAERSPPRAPLSLDDLAAELNSDHIY